MKYLVIGVGGTGGAIAAYLTKAGIDTTLIARGDNLSALRENGITLSLDNNEYTNAVKAFDMNGFENAVKSGAALSPDVIFVCVKGYSITDTIPFIKSVSKPETVVIPILNIYGTGRHMQKELPSLTVTDGCIYVSSSLVTPTIELWLHLVITTNERECKLNVLWVLCKFSLSFTSVHSRFFHNCSKIAVNQIHCSKRPNTIFQQL